jgi:predicted secreted Zn-dependent protease
MYSLLPFSLNCSFWVVPSEFASVYWENYLACGINKFKERHSQIIQTNGRREEHRLYAEIAAADITTGNSEFKDT